MICNYCGKLTSSSHKFQTMNPPNNGERYHWKVFKNGLLALLFSCINIVFIGSFCNTSCLAIVVLFAFLPLCQLPVQFYLIKKVFVLGWFCQRISRFYCTFSFTKKKAIKASSFRLSKHCAKDVLWAKKAIKFVLVTPWPVKSSHCIVFSL